VYKEKPAEGYNSDVEYEIDNADEIFLATLNGRKLNKSKSGPVQTRGQASKAKRNSITTLTDDHLEQIIDSLEKESFFKLGIRQMRDPTTSGNICCVCNDMQYDPTNALVFCNGCNMTVHQQCYGVPSVPHGPWLCRRCESREPFVQCVLCGGRNGALKRTTDSRWIHILCALWSPEVGFMNEETLEPIDGINDIPEDKWNQQCSLCNESIGVCTTCDEKECDESFHVGCARTYGLFVEASLPSGSEDDMSLTIYCKQHSLARLEHYPRYPREFRFEMPDTTRIATDLGIGDEEYDLIYSYWRVKRRVHPSPLLKRLEILSNEGYTPANSSLSEADYRARFLKLRQDFERARMLVDLVRKRELLKRQYVQTLQSIVDLYPSQFIKRAKYS